MTTIDSWEQLEVSKDQYEKRIDGIVIDRDEEGLKLHGITHMSWNCFWRKPAFHRFG